MSVTEIFERLLPALALVVGLPLVVLWWQRRRRGESRQTIRMTARIPFGKNMWVAVVEVDGRRFLLGSGERGINLITELDGYGGLTGLDLEDEMAGVFAADGDTDVDGPRMGMIRRMQQRTLRRTPTTLGRPVEPNS